MGTSFAEFSVKYRNRYSCLIILGILVVSLTGCATVEKKLGTRFYPAPPQPPKVQFLMKIYSSRDVEKQSRFQSFVVGAMPFKRFKKPYGVDVHEGVIHVCDTSGGTVVMIDLENQTFDTIRDAGAGKLRRPINLTFDETGTMYVADIALEKVMIYDKSKRFIKAFGASKQFRPVDVAVFQDRLYVLDIEDHEVEVLDKQTGEFIDVIGEPGGEEGQFFKPTNLAVDREGNLYVSDTVNCRVQEFDREGNFLLSIGRCGDEPSEFARPKGIAVDEDGFIYIVDAAFQNVQIFTPEGEPALFFGGGGGFDVPGALWLPAGIALDKSLIPVIDSIRHPDFEVKYLILVASQFGPPYISIYAFGDARPGTPLAKGDIEAYEEEEKEKEPSRLPQDVDESDR